MIDDVDYTQSLSDINDNLDEILISADNIESAVTSSTAITYYQTLNNSLIHIDNSLSVLTILLSILISYLIIINIFKRR
jgi:hypothetical protein